LSRLKAAVVGLGNIGMGYDLAGTDGDVLTHAHAFAVHPGFELVAGMDIDAERRQRFSARYGCPAYADLQGLTEHRPDVVAIAVPTAAHAAVFRQAAALRPRALLCEKPFACTLSEAEGMLAESEALGIAVMVNYMRRCEPGTLALAAHIAEGGAGDLRSGVVWYSKGLAHNGSHFIDLMRLLLGEAGEVRVLAQNRAAGEPEPDVRVVFGATPVYFLAVPHQDYGLAAFELVASKAVIRYLDGGRRIERRGAAGGRLLQPQAMPCDMGRYQWHVCEALHRHLDANAPLLSDGANALATLRVVERILAPI